MVAIDQPERKLWDEKGWDGKRWENMGRDRKG
jgi:hypothetical protein